MNKKKSMAFLAFIVLVLVGALVVESRAHFPFVNRIVMAVVEPVNSVMLGLSDIVNNTTGYFTSLKELRATNNKLEKENAILRQENVSLVSMKDENERLQRLLNYKQKYPRLEFVTSRVIGRGMGDLRDTVIINQGSDAGLKLNMSVVSSTGLVGIVDAVFPSAARVLLINSPHTRIGGMDLRGDSRIAGIVNGIAGGDGGLEMRNMARNADLLPGDTVVTSGYSGYHPPGLVIGNIEEIQMDGGGLTKIATITPSVDFSRLEEVMVITNYTNFAPLVQSKKTPAKKKEAGQGATSTQDKGGTAQ